MTAPWPKGTHPSYSAFVLELHVRKDATGSLRCHRQLQDAHDEQTATGMSASGGLEEGTWALLTETARAEALLQILVKLSNDSGFQEKITDPGGVDSGLIENLTKDILSQICRGLEEVVPHVTREAIATVRGGLMREDE